MFLFFLGNSDKITENNDTEASGNQPTIAPEFSNPQVFESLAALHVTGARQLILLNFGTIILRENRKYLI